MFLRDVANVPYGIQYHSGEQIADHVSSEKPVAILEKRWCFGDRKYRLGCF